MSWLGKLLGGKGSGEASAAHGADMSGVRLLIDSHEQKIADIGVRTFRIYPYQGDLIEKQMISFVMILSGDGDEVKFPGTGMVREISGERGLSVQFQSPQPFFDRKLMEFLARRKGGAGHGAGGGNRK